MCKDKQLKCKMCKGNIFAIFTHFNAYFYEIHGIILLESSDYIPSLTLVVKNPALGPINPSFFIF